MAYHYVLTWSLLASVIAIIVAFGLIGADLPRNGVCALK